MKRERRDGRGLGLGFSLCMSEKEKGRTKQKIQKFDNPIPLTLPEKLNKERKDGCIQLFLCLNKKTQIFTKCKSHFPLLVTESGITILVNFLF